MVSRTVGKERGDRFTLVFQCDTAFIGDADENSCRIECGRKKVDK